MPYFQWNNAGRTNECEGTQRVFLADNIEVAEVEVGEHMEVDSQDFVEVVGNLHGDTSVEAVGNVTGNASVTRLSSAFEIEDIDYGVEQAFHVEHNYGNISFCPQHVNDPFNKAIDRYIVTKSRQRLSETFGTDLLSLPWETLRYFNATWMDFMKTHLSDRMPFRTIWKKHRTWFFLMVNETHPLKSHFGCWFCISFYGMLPLTELSFFKPDIVKEEGHAVSINLRYNRQVINDHPESNIHKTLENYVMREYAKKMNSELFTNIQQGQDLLKRKNLATNIAMRSVYFLNRMVCLGDMVFVD